MLGFIKKIVNVHFPGIHNELFRNPPFPSIEEEILKALLEVKAITQEQYDKPSLVSTQVYLLFRSFFLNLCAYHFQNAFFEIFRILDDTLFCNECVQMRSTFLLVFQCTYG